MSTNTDPSASGAGVQPPHDVRELVLGVLDVMMTLGVGLANRGLVSREELARMCVVALDQQRRQPGDNQSRRFPLEVMHAVFSAPVMEGGRGRPGLVPIEGGRHDEAPSGGDAPIGA